MYEIYDSSNIGIYMAISGIIGFAILIINLIGYSTWSWIDDKSTKYNQHSPLINILIRIFGGVDCGVIIFILIFTILPLAIYYYIISLIVIVVVLMARLARYSVRHNKAFKKHVKDNKAHNQ